MQNTGLVLQSKVDATTPTKSCPSPRTSNTPARSKRESVVPQKRRETNNAKATSQSKHTAKAAELHDSTKHDFESGYLLVQQIRRCRLTAHSLCCRQTKPLTIQLPSHEVLALLQGSISESSLTHRQIKEVVEECVQWGVQHGR